MTDRKWLTTEDVAEMLGTSSRHITTLLKSKSLEGYRIGGKWRVLPKAVEAYLDSVKNTRDQEDVTKEEGE